MHCSIGLWHHILGFRVVSSSQRASHPVECRRLCRSMIAPNAGLVAALRALDQLTFANRVPCWRFSVLSIGS